MKNCSILLCHTVYSLQFRKAFIAATATKFWKDIMSTCTLYVCCIESPVAVARFAYKGSIEFEIVASSIYYIAQYNCITLRSDGCSVYYRVLSEAGIRQKLLRRSIIFRHYAIIRRVRSIFIPICIIHLYRLLEI